MHEDVNRVKVDLTLHLSPSLEKLLVEQVGELQTAIKRLEHKMAKTAEEILAKVTANTDVMKSVQIAVDGLKEGQATIADEIAALKAQVAAGTTPDFTALEAATDEQGMVVAGLKSAVSANT